MLSFSKFTIILKWERVNARTQWFDGSSSFLVRLKIKSTQTESMCTCIAPFTIKHVVMDKITNKLIKTAVPLLNNGIDSKTVLKTCRPIFDLIIASIVRALNNCNFHTVTEHHGTYNNASMDVIDNSIKR